jgi:oxygen-independent coproporphyrinogen-3 oxidase
MLEGVEQLAELDRVDPERLVELSRPGPRYTSYPTAPEWSAEVGPETYAEHLARAEALGADEPLSLYVHIPFCRQMCSYCGCNVVVARRQERADRYIEVLAREMDLVCAHLPHRRRLSQLHLGGGTPTFLTEEQLQRLWTELTARFEVLPDAEVALEIDPVVTTTGQLSLLRKLGFNRVSMGIQDFTEEVQRYVGRVQSLEQTRRLYEHARDLGYTGINFDLIFGLPKQRLETFERTLEQVVELGPDRVAVFSYAHVPWMRSHQRRFDEALIPRPVERFQLFGAALRHFLEAGYLQIGMDHFARPDDELARARLERRLHRNFQGYTVRPASDMLAIGITGIADVRGLYAQNLKPLARYYRAVEAGRLPTERGWVLSADDELRRALITRLMCNFHVDLAEIGAAYNLDPTATFATELEELRTAEAQGLLRREDQSLELTPLGRILVRNVAMVFDPYLRRRVAAGGGGQTFSKTL